MVRYETVVHLHDTDSAGVLFFANQFKIAHDGYEVFLQEIGFPIRSFFSDRKYFLPIVHARADYSAPLHVGDRLIIDICSEVVKDSSFTLVYTLQDAGMRVVGQVKTVHVSVDAASGQKIKLPDDLRRALLQHQL